MSRTVVQIVVLVLLSVLLVSAGQTDTHPHTHQLASRSDSLSFDAPYCLFSVCDAEIQEFCPLQKDAPLKCLLQHFSAARQSTRSSAAMQARPHPLHAYSQWQRLQSKPMQPGDLKEPRQGKPVVLGKGCSSWLRAREVCVTYVRRTGRCHASETARECMRRVPASLLPPGCRNTDYYRSVILYGEMKRQTSP